MEYTVGDLAKLAGVSTRTLRYYDQIGLLKPAGINASGYRIYGPAEVDKLQQILFYKSLDVDLERMKEILNSPTFDKAAALREHRQKLLAKKAQLDLLIANVEKSIAAIEGRITMSDKEKFEGFKKELIRKNEDQYGAEARQKYGNEAVDASNAKVAAMTKEEWEKLTGLEKEMKENLKIAFNKGDPACAEAQKAADLHRQWLCFFWPSYSKEAHAGVAQMYVDDPRFTAYYDKEQPGLAAFLRDAIFIYTGKQRNTRNS
ncbi:MAG TPA: MerR family transcriptional regulator [Firmicutes bacterium]|nr:MerR family transcriptional regulator [Bacillota bacterium]